MSSMEILVFPMEEQKPEKTDIELAVQSLIGAIPATDMSLIVMVRILAPLLEQFCDGNLRNVLPYESRVVIWIVKSS